MRDAALARPHQGCSVASVAWTSNGALYVTIAVKATLALRDGGPSALVTAAPVETQDRFTTRDERGSLLVARELFPYRPRVDVTITGHAQLPPGGVGIARLAVRGEGGWIDKSLEVRPPPTQGRTALPPSRVPLGWEATWADDENPIGVPRGSLAWILDSEQPGKAVGFGPIAAHWSRRTSALCGVDPAFLENDAPRFPEGFDWEYFHAAPADQQLSWIDGSETIELDGILDRAPALRTSLPELVAGAWAFAPWEVAEGQPLDLVPDGIAIDADRALAHVVWRATYPMLGEDWSLSQLQLVASVEARVAPAAAASLVSVPAARRTPSPSLSRVSLVEMGAKPAPPIAPPAHPAASLFDTDDGEDAGTRPLTRKELLAAMAQSGKALPFGPPKRVEHGKTSEIEVPPPPPAGPTPARSSEQTRPIPHDAIFGADGDHGTVAGDDDELERAASVKLPAFLRTDGPRSLPGGGGRAPLDTDLDSPSAVARRQAPEQGRAPEQDDASFADDETYAADDPARR